MTSPGTLLVTLTVADLSQLVRDAVSEALPEPTTSPALLDRRSLAQALLCSVDIVDRLRREGLPQLLVGDAPRFRLDAVLAWLEAREHQRTKLGDHHPAEPKTPLEASESARSNQHGTVVPMIPRTSEVAR